MFGLMVCLTLMVAMIPKSGGDATPLGQRPLCVLPVVYRVWASAGMMSCSLGTLQCGEVRTVSLLVASVGTLGFGHYFHKPRVFGSHCTLFSFASEEFFPVSVTGGVPESPGVVTPR